MTPGIRCSFRLVAAIALSAFANASDWYVDAVVGSDGNAGTSATSAWKTITYALASAPSGAQTIHVLPGVYDTANGEVFPLTPRSDFAVVGDAGSAFTTVDVGAAPVDIFVFETLAVGAPAFGPGTLVEGLALRGGSHGVRSQSQTADIALTLRDLDIAGSAIGVELRLTGNPIQSVLMEGVRAHGCQTGMRCYKVTLGTNYTLTVRDSSFSQCMQDGVLFWNSGFHGLFERTRFDQNNRNGIFCTLPPSSAALSAGCNAAFTDCSFSRNLDCGWSSGDTYNDEDISRYLTFTRCTIARNTHYGVLLYSDGFNVVDFATFSHSIVSGNHVDILVGYLGGDDPTLIRCCIADGSYLGVNGPDNFSGNPQFVSGATGDFHLRWGSPCIDIATTAPPVGALDLDGHARTIDGDLDTAEVSDIGAYEFRPLELVGTGQLGSLIQWKLWGPQGNPSLLYWTRVGLASTPVNTSYGELDLDPALASVFRVTTAGSPTPTILQRSIPNAGALLLGRTFAFQALTDCVASPSGKAYSNPVEVTIVP